LAVGCRFRSFNSLHAQQVQHAPTVEQCRADQRLWFSRLEDLPAIKSVSYKELGNWLVEMGDCEHVNPENQVSVLQHNKAEINAQRVMRLEHFLDRHHLYDQFLAEDAQGKGRQ
jgi:hypothetical protein